jgi:hypothetical protein
MEKDESISSKERPGSRDDLGETNMEKSSHSPRVDSTPEVEHEIVYFSANDPEDPYTWSNASAYNFRIDI